MADESSPLHPASSPSMPTDEEVNWDMCGQGEEDGEYIYYREAKVSWEPDGSTRFASRRFKLGDLVFLAVECGQPFVGQLLEFYVTKSKTPEKRITLRWLYYPEDLKDDVDRSIVPDPIPEEMYFSDHVDLSGNPIEVIDGRVFPCETVEMLNMRTRGTFPRGYWAGDRFVLVRAFYGTMESDPCPLVMLHPNELNQFVMTPTTDSLYVNLRAIRKLHARTPPSLASKKKKLSRAEKLAKRRKHMDNQQRRRERFAAKNSGLDSPHGKRVYKDDDSMFMDDDPPGVDNRNNPIQPFHERLFTESSLERAPNEPPGLTNAISTMKEVYALMSAEQKEHYCKNLKPMLDACLRQMQHQNLAFDMNDEQKVALADFVVRKFEMRPSNFS